MLRSGELFAAATVSRFNDPELEGVMPKREPFAFEAEEAPQTVADVFGEVEVDQWDAPLMRLPDRVSVEKYLRTRGLAEAEAREASERFELPLTLTKRGVLILAYRRER